MNSNEKVILEIFIGEKSIGNLLYFIAHYVSEKQKVSDLQELGKEVSHLAEYTVRCGCRLSVQLLFPHFCKKYSNMICLQLMN